MQFWGCQRGTNAHLEPNSLCVSVPPTPFTLSFHSVHYNSYRWGYWAVSADLGHICGENKFTYTVLVQPTSPQDVLDIYVTYLKPIALCKSMYTVTVV